MPNHVVFLVHGMGANPADGNSAWFLEVEQALDRGWKMFQPLRRLGERSKFIEFVPISYDKPIVDYLSGVAKNGDALDKFLDENALSSFFEGLGKAGEEPNFFWDDVFDVLYYRFAGDRYRELHAVVAQQIVDTALERWRTAHDPIQFSMITHSLGTAVANGALNRLGGGEIGDATTFSLGNRFHLNTYMALANVSGLLWRDQPGLYEATIVRPNDEARSRKGYVGKFINARNVYDPFPIPYQFLPTDWGPRYQSLPLKHIHQLNVHGYTHYLAHPEVVGSFFQSLFSPFLSTTAIDEEVANFDELAPVREPADRTRIRALADGLAKSLNESYADPDLLGDTFKLFGRLFRDLWTLRKDLSAIGAFS